MPFYTAIRNPQGAEVLPFQIPLKLPSPQMYTDFLLNFSFQSHFIPSLPWFSMRLKEQFEDSIAPECFTVF